jgi:Transglutaminase-like superfamily
MQRFHNFCRLPASYRHLFVKALLLLGIVRVGLWLLPFQTLMRLFAHMTRAHAALQDGDHAGMQQVIWAVTVASQYVPAATCLTQALATQVLLSRRGHPASLHIGVARSDTGDFLAHAWVECQGKVVIGGLTAPARFTPLLSLEE